MTTAPLHPTTIAHRAPVPVDRLERVLKVPRNPPKVMGEYTPLHACICLDQACRVHHLSKAFICLPRYLPLPRLRYRSAPLVCRGRHCGSPHKGTLVVRRDGNRNDCGEPSIFLRLYDGINDAGRYTPLQSVPALCSTCTDSIVVGRLELLTRQSGLSQPLMMKFGEWWPWWESRPRALVRASYIFQGRSSSHKPWVGVA